MTTLSPRAVVIHRRSELDDLVQRHGTRGQAEFFLRSRGRTLTDVQDRHAALTAALTHVSAAIPRSWRRGSVERDDLPRFLFDPHDIVVVVGQDGLVANTAKYLTGQQPVIGVDPDPGRNPGILVPHAAADAGELMTAAADGSATIDQRTMVTAATDDGQTLTALNEIYFGHPSHQSARYLLDPDPGRSEAQSSSGLIVTTGTGATGWAASLNRQRSHRIRLPAATDPTLAWFVREAWPSPATSTSHTQGSLQRSTPLQATVQSDRLVVFGDGLEYDHLTATWGQTVTFTVAERTLRHVACDDRE